MATDRSPQGGLSGLATALGIASAKRAAMIEQVARQHGIPLTVDVADLDIGDMLVYAVAPHEQRVKMDVGLITRLVQRLAGGT